MSESERWEIAALYGWLAVFVGFYLFLGEGWEWLITAGATPGAIWYIANMYTYLNEKVEFVKSLARDLQD